MRKKIIICLVLLCLGVGGLFVYVDQKVARLLGKENAKELPAIYSDPFKLSNQIKLPLATLKEELLVRGYEEVSRTPANPGEFMPSKTSIKIMTRAFQLPNSTTAPALLKEYPPAGDDPEPFYLEPRVVAPLGSGEQRANQFKNLEEIPRSLQQAVVAIEDERFRDHHGIDILGVMRAIFEDIRALSLVQGGSTLTQQLAKNALFSARRTLTRKVLEAFAAFSIERRFTKDQILEMYLNEIYLGQEGAVALHGVAEAAQSFFAKNISDISIAEAAMLAGIIKAPSYFSPRNHGDRAHERKEVVLAKMRELGFITEQEFNQAKKAKINIVKEIRYKRTAPFYITALRGQLEETLGEDAPLLDGMRVYTGLSLEMQSCAENAIENGLAKIEKQYPKTKRADHPLEVGLVSIETYSGLVRAWVGGRNFSDNQFNHVNQAKRQVGSTIKPFLYLTALDSTLNSYKIATPISILADEPITVDQAAQQSWEPENYDRRFRGDVTLRYALENSLNLPAVYVGQRVGANALANTVEKFRLTEHALAIPALALGALDSTPLQVAAAYAALANEGRYVKPRLFVSVIDKEGEVALHDEIQEEAVADEDAVYVLTNILQGVLERGTGKAIRALGYTDPAAGKTGTSNDARDAWFAGYTPTLATVVWLGYDDNEKVGLTGGTLAAPIWANYMQCVAPFHEHISFAQPPGVIFTTVDTQSGQLATDQCPSESVIKEVFVRGTEPRTPCNMHGGIRREVPMRSDELPAPRTGRRKKSFWDFLFDN